MKIEKVNENQIRCTLTKDDLADRELKLSELAYGTEKAKSLFRDMMQQASYEFGFEAEDIPLMIEAIPLSPDCIILIITKVEDPDELDTRFSKFAPAAEGSLPESDHTAATFAEGADDILGLFKKLHEEKNKLAQPDNFVPLPETISSNEKKEEKAASKHQTNAAAVPINLTKLYSFKDLDTVIRLAGILNRYYNGINSLYKSPMNQRFYLTLGKAEHTPEEFNKVCNILSEYGVPEKYTPAAEAYFSEHYEMILSENALQQLTEI